MIDKTVWNIKELKGEKEEGTKLFRIDWTEEYRDYGHAIVRARNIEEAKKKFLENDCESNDVDDSEFIDSWIDEIEEIN